METIRVVIEKTKAMYSAYAENTKGIMPVATRLKR